MTKRTKRTRWIPENSVKIIPEEAPRVTAYLYNSGHSGKPCIIAYMNKKTKSFLHTQYGTEERRAEALAEHRKWWGADHQQHLRYRAERDQTSQLQAGDIIYVTWGYDQTNADFYEVLSLTASRKSARIRHLKSSAKENGFMSGHATPNSPREYESPATTCRTVGKDGVNTEYSQYGGPATKWDGSPVSVSWYC